MFQGTAQRGEGDTDVVSENAELWFFGVEGV